MAILYVSVDTGTPLVPFAHRQTDPIGHVWRNPTTVLALDSNATEVRPALQLDLSPQAASICEQEASRAGISVDMLIERTFAPKGPVNQTERIKRLLVEWQRIDGTPTAAPPPNDGSMTPSEALFRQWEQEDDHMTDEERQAEAELCQQFQCIAVYGGCFPVNSRRQGVAS